MASFILGVVLLAAGIAIVVLRRKISDEYARGVAVGGAASVAVGLLAIFFSTTIHVQESEGGLVVRKIFGGPMSGGQIVATDSENGPQARVLPPGWHFWYWPWDYDLEHVPNIQIPSGSVGVVTARDGIPLPDGQVFADAWDDPKKMLDGHYFLTSGKGYAGPQLSVLPPANYRYNPRLFDIKIMPALTVKVGFIVVVKANAGKIYKAQDGESIELVNGVPMVPKGYRGIWNVALTPDMYYIHPDAMETIQVKATNRIYTYTSSNKLSQVDRPSDDNSIGVRTKDGFEFPVDVRVSVKITAENAPYAVARIGDPDSDDNKDGFDALEEIVILPAVRAIFRNSAEQRGALEYVASRSDIEKTSTEQFRSKLQEFKIETDGLFVADIGLSKTPEGKLLLATQTEKETANQEKDTWAAKRDAQIARAESVKAETEAEKEKDKVEAKVKIDISKDEAQAKIELATGEAESARKVIEAVGGFENYLTIKVAEMVVERWEGQIPEVLVTSGEGAGLDAAVLAKMIQEMIKQTKTEQAELPKSFPVRIWPKTEDDIPPAGKK